MQLFQTPDNPVPGEPVLMTVTTRDGIPLRVARWHPAGAVQGRVCILQGRAEFIEKYFETVSDLLVRGFAVVVFDWRGQGHSGRQVANPRKGHVRHFRDYRKDLDAIRDHVLIPHMPEPHFALAHSMGGAIALDAAHGGWLPFKRLVTTTPMLGLSMVRNLRSAALAALALYWLGFGKSFIPGGGETSIATKPFAGNRLTSDPVRYARNAAAAYAVRNGAIGDPTVGWIHSAFRFMRRFADPRYPLKIRVPTLIIAAGADPVCSTPVTERFASRLKAGRAIVIPGARHEILMERDVVRELFWAAFDAFVPGTSDPVFGDTDPVLLDTTVPAPEEPEEEPQFEPRAPEPPVPAPAWAAAAAVSDPEATATDVLERPRVEQVEAEPPTEPVRVPARLQETQTSPAPTLAPPSGPRNRKDRKAKRKRRR